MKVSLLDSPLDGLKWNLGHLEASETSDRLDEMAEKHYGLWNNTINSYLTNHYDRMSLHDKDPLRLLQGVKTDRWHVVRRSEPHHDSTGRPVDANIGFVVSRGMAIIFARRARLLVTGHEDRALHVQHLWRRCDVTAEEVERDGQEVLLPRSAHVLVSSVPDRKNGYQIDIGDDWACIRYRGPIFSHPDETLSLQLLYGGVAFAIAGPIEGNITLTHDLGVADEPLTICPRIFQKLTPPNPHKITFFRRARRVAWALRLCLEQQAIAWPLDLECDMPRTSWNGTQNLGQRYLAIWLHQLRNLCPECGPAATFYPDREVSPKLQDSSELPPPFNSLPGFDPLRPFFSSQSMKTKAAQICNSLTFKVDDSTRRLTATCGRDAKPVYFMPFQLPPPRCTILLFIDSTTFFYLDTNDSSGKLAHPPGLPRPFGVGLIGIQQPKKFAQQMEQAIGHTTDKYSMLSIVAALFHANPLSPSRILPTFLTIGLAHDADRMVLQQQFDGGPDGEAVDVSEGIAEDEDPMDLVGQSF